MQQSPLQLSSVSEHELNSAAACRPRQVIGSLASWRPTGSLGGALVAAVLLSACQSTPTPSDSTISRLNAEPAVLNSPATTNRVSDQPSPSNRPVKINNSFPWLENIHPLYLHARNLVERELGTNLRNIRLLLVDDAPINAEVSRETWRLVNEQFGTSQFADNFLDQVMNNQSGTYAALFTSRLKAVMVSRNMLSNYENSLPSNPELRAAALLTLLIHELVHAADDQRYKIHENRALNFRASFAQSATFEGHAQWVTRRICAKNGCTIGLEALDNFMFSRDEQFNEMTQPVEAISRNVLEYSYVEGERFINSLAQRENGIQLIDDLLRNPPFDPIQILAPESFPDVPREQRNQRMIRASLEVDHPWVRGDWVGVETSPLKGVNLRADPSRRRAAVDGFTRLIDGMVSMQLYDRKKPDDGPAEVTLIQAESADTARLFARTLYNNAQTADVFTEEEPLQINTAAGNVQSHMKMYLYRTSVPSETPYRTSIGVSGEYVVQIAATSASSTPLDDYAIRVLLNLQLRN